eukprot:COSAG05_NODE_1679_length_4291_cov_102.969704_7_plen_50_part_00
MFRVSEFHREESSVVGVGGGDGEHVTHIGDMGVDIENRLRRALDAGRLN